MALYGGFLQDADRKLCERVRHSNPQELAAWQPAFTDERLQTLYFRYRARNWPDSLTAGEQERWRAYCRARIEQGVDGSGLTLETYADEIAALRNTGDLTTAESAILDRMEEWPSMILP